MANSFETDNQKHAVRETSLLAYKQILRTMPDCCRPVFAAICDTGPIHDKGILNYLRRQEAAAYKPKRARRPWEANIITGRRNDLVKMGAVKDLGTFTRQDQSRPVHLWYVASESNTPPPGWKRADQVKYPKQQKTPAERKAFRQRIREQAERPVLDKLKEQRVLF